MPYVTMKKEEIRKSFESPIKMSEVLKPEMFKKEPAINMAIQTEVHKAITVKVIFRKWKGELIAFFPELPGDNEWLDTCLSYQHIGQHASASTNLHGLLPVTPEEYHPLWRELTEIVGYNLIVIERFKHRSDREARKREIERNRS